MIKQIKDNYYNFKVKNTVYYLHIKELHWNPTYFYIECINRRYDFTFYKSLGIIDPGTIANRYLGKEIYYSYCFPIFNTKEKAIGFLFFLDRNYNSKPQQEIQFIDLKLIIPE